MAPHHLAEINALRIEAEERADVLYKTLKLSVGELKRLGFDVSGFNVILKEYKK